MQRFISPQAKSSIPVSTQSVFSFFSARHTSRKETGYHELSKDALEGVVRGAPKGGQGMEQPLPGPPPSSAAAPRSAFFLHPQPIAERLPRLPRPPCWNIFGEAGKIQRKFHSTCTSRNGESCIIWKGNPGNTWEEARKLQRKIHLV